MTPDFRIAPFHLDQTALDWVEARFAAMSDKQKLGQLFNILLLDTSEAALQTVLQHQPGSIAIHHPGTPEQAQARLARLNAALAAPLLVAADLEGSFSAPPGTTVMPNPLGMAAAGSVEDTAAAISLIAGQAAEYGINWSFTPQIDINHAFKSAITATRGFGSNLQTIRAHGLAAMTALQGAGTAACAKHWPGEGYDDRDQHLVTTINPLSLAEWKASFGLLYRALIDEGVLSVMSAHIAFPAWLDTLPGAKADRLRPASINKYLNIDLLRGELGFNGLIVSDATPMAGLSSFSHRRNHLPEIIANGCDVILFTDDIAQDIAWLEAALADGRLSWDRVNDAVRRQLALKAAINLHKPAAPRAPRNRAADEEFAVAYRARSITLVHDHPKTLPLSPARHRKILLVSKGVVFPFAPKPLPLALPDLLRAEGFEVTLHPWGTPVDPTGHDLLLYVQADETLLTRGTIFIDWREMTGSFIHAMQRPWHDIPTLMVSLGYPYHLYDAPSMPTYINAYSATPEMQQSLVGGTARAHGNDRLQPR